MKHNKKRIDYSINMPTLEKIKRGISNYIYDPEYKIGKLLIRFVRKEYIPDRILLKYYYHYIMGEKLNLKKPTTFCEKIQWLKLYNRREDYTIMVNKDSAKNYVAKKIGDQYIIPTIGVWEKPEDIEWDKLPDKFVLKTTHGGGNNGVVICKDKSAFCKMNAISKLNESMQIDLYNEYREWPYKNVKKRIIAEAFLNNGKDEDLPDYKFFCFDGVPMFCQVIRNRNSKESIDFYDMDWKHQEFVGLTPVASNGLTPVARPQALEEMKNICRKLSQGIPFVRVDLYEIKSAIYFGELTFFPASGFGKFTPDVWNERLGNMLKLPRTFVNFRKKTTATHTT